MRFGFFREDKEDSPSPLVKEKDVVDAFYKATMDVLKEKGFPVESVYR